MLSEAQKAVVQTVARAVNNDGCELQILVDGMQDVTHLDPAKQAAYAGAIEALREAVRQLETVEYSLIALANA